MPDPTIRPAGQGVALCDDAVVQIAREAVAAVHDLYDEIYKAHRIRTGHCDHWLDVGNAILGARAAAAALSAGAGPCDRLKFIEDECLDVRCINEPTGGDDYDVGWIVIEHYEAEPQERRVGYGRSPAEAIDEAWRKVGHATPSPVAAGEAVSPSTLKAAEEALERMAMRKDEPWPSDRLVRDLVTAGESEYEPTPPAELVAGLVERLRSAEQVLTRKSGDHPPGREERLDIAAAIRDAIKAFAASEDQKGVV